MNPSALHNPITLLNQQRIAAAPKIFIMDFANIVGQLVVGGK